LLNQMTEAQKSAVTHAKGACLVLAGPGSGKTFVITGRLIHMVKELKIPGEHILVITFTKAAAMEMEARFQRQMPDEHPWFGTFHSCFYYILRNSYTSIPTRFISNDEKKKLLKSLCEKIFRTEKELEYDELDRVFSLYMNCGLSVPQDTVLGNISQEELKELYIGYHKALTEQRFMDFDDLMLCCYQLLKENQAIRKRWQEQFCYILIDECQDMNILQYEIVKLLAGPEQNVFMVGDDDQSIYRFRGAKVELMQKFTEEFCEVRQLQLDQNFRSVPDIVLKSMKVIEQNKNRFHKKITASKTSDIIESGVSIKKFPRRQDMYECIFEALMNTDNNALHQSAIIYRTNKEVRNMAYKLRRKGIPYSTKEEKEGIFDEEWYLDMEAYIKLGLGSLKREDILRVANKPNRFIAREQLVNISKLPESLGKAVVHINSMRPFLAFKYIWSGIGYGKWLEQQLGRDSDELNWIKERYEEIVQEMKQFNTLEAWIKHVEEDRLEQKAHRNKSIKFQRDEENAGVHLLTMHASKGLEFENVYLPDVNKGKIPKGSKLSKEELEEERRLFYVAMTRAKTKLHIYYVGGEKDHVLQPSVFLEPILQ